MYTCRYQMHTVVCQFLSCTVITSPLPVLSISFEVDVHTGKVGGSLFFERRRRKLPRGVWGHAPQKILKFRSMLRNAIFSIWALRTIKIKNIF